MNLKNLKLPYLFNERFELIALLGVGGMGSVFMAQDKILEKAIAIKILNSEFLDAQIVRFQQEAKAIAKLNHANILEVYDFAKSSDGHFYLAMELIEGESLHDYLESLEVLPVEDVLAISIKLLSGLEHAHSNSVLHRDIKPSNVMLTKKGEQTYQVKLVDFGLAKVSLEGQALTATGVVMGSPLYMSPEQGEGLEVDARSDIYSFGCLLFKALTGKVPFQGKDALQTITMRKFEQAPKLSKVRDDLSYPPGVEEIVGKCLATEAGDRYQTVAELITHLKLELEKLSGSSYSGSENLDEKLKDDSKSQLAWVVMIIVVTGIIALTVLFPLIGRFGEKVIEDSQPDTKLKEVSFSIPFGVKIPVITEDKIAVAVNRTIVDGKPVYERSYKSESEKLSIGAYKKLVQLSKQAPIYKISLNGCYVDDIAMKYIIQIRGVEELRLSENEAISPDSFKLLNKMPSLRRLNVNRMKLTDKHIESLAGASNLTRLDISRNPNLTSAIFDSLILIPNLESLVCGQPNISLEKFVYFANSKPNFFHLGLRVFPKDDLGAENLALLKHIRRLDLMQCQFTNRKKVIDYLAQSKCVNFLELSSTETKGQEVLCLNSNPNLTGLTMDHCRLDDEDASVLAKLEHVDTLSVRKNSGITIKGVKDIAKNKRVISLYVSRTDNIQHDHYTRPMLDKLLTDSP